MVSSLVPVSIQNCARMGRKVHTELIRTSFRLLSRIKCELRFPMYEFYHTIYIWKKVMPGNEWETPCLPSVCDDTGPLATETTVPEPGKCKQWCNLPEKCEICFDEPVPHILYPLSGHIRRVPPRFYCIEPKKGEGKRLDV
jgi:hypothetical protein